MFAGIVTTVGRVQELPEGLPGQLVLGHPMELIPGAIGDSLAVNGCCLTIVAARPGQVSLEVIPETLRRTTLGTLGVGDPVNLEPALLLQSSVGGHLVSGHVDATGRIIAISREQNSLWLEVEVPASVARYCVPQGSIALDGCSLTLVTVEDRPPHGAVVRVSLIPHTVAQTIAADYLPGVLVNLEADQIAKLVERLLGPHLAGRGPLAPEGEGR
ncbi:MAG TPA: riboflavin synthase [Candidatus Nanopelagicaceae bacterium]|nr:riboflavin synthase [Candidatus Nanopelagicaceae bacterium]